MDMEVLKSQLGYAWCDSKTEGLLSSLVQEALAYLRRYRPRLDEEDDPFVRSLVVEYVRYALANARDDFKTNYFEEILSLSGDGVLDRLEELENAEPEEQA